MRQTNHAALTRLEHIRTGELPMPPMWANLALEVGAIASGVIEMTTLPEARHLNAFGGVHGGYIAAVLDTVLGLAVYTSIGPDDRHITVDLAVKLLKAPSVGVPLVAASELVHVSRSVGVSQAWLRDAAGVLYAHGTTTCNIRRAATA
ncbi:MAG: PaaI family thioesterase [Gammaproteobacteria bacterium]